MAWFSLHSAACTTASFSLCFLAQNYQGLTICVCNAASEREHDLSHSGCPSSWKEQSCSDFLLLLSPVLCFPSEQLSEFFGDRGHHQQVCTFSWDSNGETWNRNDPKSLFLHGHRIPGVSLIPALRCFNTLPGTAPLSTPENHAEAKPFTASFREFSVPAPKYLTRARHR